MTSKKSIFKRILSCLLAMSFMIAPVFAEETKSDDRALLQVEFLEALGIYDSDRTMMSDTQGYLTRENLAVILGGFFGLEPTAPVGAENDTGFLDIEPDHWAAERIKAVADRKIMSGYSDGYFRPNNNATFEQAVKTLVVLAGHDISAEIYGGWSAGYMSIANELGITDGVSLGLTDPIKKGQFTQLVVNLLDAEMLNVTFSSTGELYYEHTNRIFMNEILGIYVEKGVMTANDKTALLGKNNANEGFITVNGVDIKADSSYSDYLGYSVNAYYKYDADEAQGNLLWIEEGKKNSVIEVKGEDIVNPDSNGYFEYEEGENVNKVRIAERLSLSVIYNGMLKNLATSADLAPKNGTVKLIDAQKDGVFETVMVWNYYDFVLDSIFMQDDKISIVDKRGEVAVLDITLADNYSLDITKDGAQTDLSSITSGSIISVAAESFTQNIMDTVTNDDVQKINLDASSVKIVSSTKSVIGKLDTYNNKGYTIDGTVYEFSPCYNASTKQVNIGIGLTAYLNKDGKITYIKLSDGWDYCFIKKVALLDDDKTVLIRLFTSDGVFVDYNVEKIKIDGEVRKGSQIVDDLNASGTYFKNNSSFAPTNRDACNQMAKCYMKNNKLAELDTMVYNSAIEEENSFGTSKKINITSKTSIASGNAKIIGDEMFLFPTTAKYFIIPPDMDTTDAFSVQSILTSRENTNRKDFFDMDDMNIAPLVVEYGTADKTVDYRSINDYDMIFQEKSYELNADGDPTYVLKGIHLATGNEMELELENESVYDAYLGDDLEIGDIVSWNLNYKSQASNILRVYDYSENKYDSEVEKAQKETNNFEQGLNIFVGTIQNRRDNYLLINDMITGKTYIPDRALANFSTNGKVYVVEVDNETIRRGTLAEINTVVRYGDEADTIFLRYEYYTPMRLVIYK